MLSKPGLDGGIFLVPSSIMGQQKGYPDMNTMLHLNDIVKFEAVPQEEKNGIKWQALDGSVEMLRSADRLPYPLTRPHLPATSLEGKRRRWSGGTRVW